MDTGHAVACGLLMFIAIFFSSDISVQEKIMLHRHICFSETFLKMRNTIGGLGLYPSWLPK